MHNFKKIRIAILFVLVCVVITGVLNYLLIPNSIARVKINNLHEKKYDDLFIGTSHGLSAINPQFVDPVTDRKSLNLCMPDEYLIDSYYLVKEACSVNKPSRIIYELDPSYWSTKQNIGANASYIYQNFPDSLVKLEYFKAKIMEMDFRVTIANWFYYRDQYKKALDNIALKRSKEYKEASVATFEKGVQEYTQEGYMYQTITPETNKGTMDFVKWNENKVQLTEKESFEKLVKYCKQEGIELVVITTPVPRETLEKDLTRYVSANKYFTKLMKNYGIEYKDFNSLQDTTKQKTIEEFVDYEGHMSGEMGNEFSTILGEYLKK